jgi:hypothetical protein
MDASKMRQVYKELYPKPTYQLLLLKEARLKLQELQSLMSSFLMMYLIYHRSFLKFQNLLFLKY